MGGYFGWEGERERKMVKPSCFFFFVWSHQNLIFLKWRKKWGVKFWTKMSNPRCVFCFASFIFFPDNVIFPISSFYLKCYSFLYFYNYFSSVLVFFFFWGGYSFFFYKFFPQFWVLEFIYFCFFLMKCPFMYVFLIKI